MSGRELVQPIRFRGGTWLVMGIFAGQTDRVFMKNGPYRLRRSVSGSIFVLILTMACGEDPSGSSSPRSPIVFLPGFGMGALHVRVDSSAGGPAEFAFLLPPLNPSGDGTAKSPTPLLYALNNGLTTEDIDDVPGWLELMTEEDGSVRSLTGVTVEALSTGVDFLAECPRYRGWMEKVEGEGWTRDQNLYCAPYDYRFPPGKTNDSIRLMALIEKAFEESGGVPVSLMCHSQGCLIAYHFLRTMPEPWLEKNVGLFFSFAGQFSGCSDCIRWAFQKRWDWDSEDALASDSDPTWAGENALGLESEMYEGREIFRVGLEPYFASTIPDLLSFARAVDTEKALGRYELTQQTWYQKGSQLREALSIPARFVYGSEIPTTMGYSFEAAQPSPPACREPSCGPLYSRDYPGLIQMEGDGGMNGIMTRAPMHWTADPACEMRAIPGIQHMDIFDNEAAIRMATELAGEVLSGDLSCLQ